MTALESGAIEGLVYTSDQTPGIRRRRAGRGFAYTHHDGRRVDDPDLLARVRALHIPPAYTDVWISPAANGHVQATGRDARRRKQYIYHPAWRDERDASKYERLMAFGESLPAIRKQLASDLAAPGLGRAKITATVVHVLQSTFVRIGNEEYARTNGSYGLTTLRVPHVTIQGADVRFEFDGKSGKRQAVRIHDPRVARVLRRCQDLPGQRLFQYLDESGTAHAIGSEDVNAYLRAATGGDYTAKDFRTWTGTLLACAALATLDPPRSDRDGRRAVAATVQAVARRLGNTPAVARASYVHPDVIDLYVNGELDGIWSRGPKRDARWLLREERRLIGVLYEARRRRDRSHRSVRAVA